jgi:hypothetical protein
MRAREYHIRFERVRMSATADGATTCYHQRRREGVNERERDARVEREIPAKERKRTSSREWPRRRVPSRQAGGHWFEPSTAHWKKGARFSLALLPLWALTFS